MRKGLNVKPIYSVVLLAAWLAPALKATPAQDPPPPQQPAAATARAPEKVVEMLGAKLHPSDDQKARIEPVIRDRQQKLAELRSDASMQKKRKLKSIFLESDAQ